MSELNYDTAPIKNWDITPEGYMTLWVAMGVANEDLVYQDSSSDSGERKEFITLDNLKKDATTKSAMGKPVVLNHPPQPVVVNNIKQHSLGTLLQQFEPQGDTLYQSAVVHDADTIQRIKNKEITHTSYAYYAEKKLNSDGKYEQITRHVNHCGLLEASKYKPRAGENSNVLIQGDAVYKQAENGDLKPIFQSNSETQNQTTTMPSNQDSNVNLPTSFQPIIDSNKPQPQLNFNQFNTPPINSNPQVNNDSRQPSPPESNNQKQDDYWKAQYDSVISEKESLANRNKYLENDFPERAKLVQDWSEIVKDKGQNLDFNLDSRGIRLQILSCYYNQDAVKLINTSEKLEGAWIQFMLSDGQKALEQKEKQATFYTADGQHNPMSAINAMFPHFENTSLTRQQGYNRDAKMPTEAELINDFNRYIGAE